MVVVTARIDDPERALLRPGQFAEVTVAVGRADRPVVPETAIRPSERGFLAYVVEGDTPGSGSCSSACGPPTGGSR